jgi:hypothetical protein
MTLQQTRFAALCVLLLLSACGFRNEPIWMHMSSNQLDGEHSPDFKQGWEDGCRSGETVYGNTFTKAVADGYTRDPTKVHNPAYESAWNDAYNYCRQQQNTNINNWDSDWWGLLTLE